MASSNHKGTRSDGQLETVKRCRTNRLIRTHAGNVPPYAMGTIIGEINNLGRHMLQVRWDGGFCAYVFPDEIEMLTTTSQ
jgi:hypothetical protein